MKKLFLRLSLWAVAAVTLSAQAQEQVAKDWHHRDLQNDSLFGISTITTYQNLLAGRKSQPIIVAVIDSGTDTIHEDLKDILWINNDELPGNGKDDDNNGYVDDVNGWNFIGGKDGKNVNEDNLELTRLYRQLKPKYENKNSKDIAKEDKREYELYICVKKDLEEKRAENTAQLNYLKNLLESLEGAEKQVGGKITKDNVKQLSPKNEFDSMAFQLIARYVSAGMGLEPIKSSVNAGMDHFSKQLNYSLNPEFDPRHLVGDNYFDATERFYGNNNLVGDDPAHGTHVSGIIAAIRDNKTGMNGIANDVSIMVLRVVPDGDERDKDVANAIRYAVDNGAKVINMSFGKSYAFNKQIVDEAVKYAESKDVLLVHAAGNDSKNNDKGNNFPNPRYDGGGVAKNWIEVGASTFSNNETLPASFSNYGKKNVDVFAPGYQIYSTTPGSQYAQFSGTSMASPVVAGLAALLRSYFPELSAEDVKEIIEDSVVPVKYKVIVPGTAGNKDKKGRPNPKKVKFSKLCKTGGVVNAHRAIELAIKRTSGK